MKPLHEQAYTHLKSMIENGMLSYHEIYSETKIAKEIGISRTPFRDAIHRLVQDGYIDIIPSKGFQLHQLSVRDVTETFQVRSALECFCTLEITKHYQSEEAKELFTQLRIIMKQLKKIMSTSHSIEEFCQHDFMFHEMIIQYVNNEQFESVFYSFSYRMERLALLSLAHEQRMEQTYQEHLAILQAMERGDAANIYNITLAHMDTPRGINLEDVLQ